MKGNDSRECRNCHNFESFDYAEQGRRSAVAHQKGLGEGKTCIDCHKGIAHTLPAVEQGVGADKQGASPQEFHPDASKAGEPGGAASGGKSVDDGPAPVLKER